MRPDDDERQLARARRSLQDLSVHRPARYWRDLLLDAGLGWAGVGCAVLGVGGWPGTLAAGAVAAVAMFRASVLLHEIAHLRPGEVPGLRLAWNVLWGVPFLLPSYLYERIHMDHHRRSSYATAGDPEYVPVATQGLASLLLASAITLLLPLGLVLRFLVITPLSPLARATVDARANSLASNPAYRAKPLRGPARAAALVSEATCFAWGWSLVALVATGLLPLRVPVVLLAVFVATAALSQLRTLAAHRWASFGEASDVGVLADSFNVEPGSRLVRALIPPGGRLHALHHLAPAVPYHDLDAAHGRLLASLPADSSYRRCSVDGYGTTLGALLRAIRANARRST